MEYKKIQEKKKNINVQNIYVTLMIINIKVNSTS